MKIERFELYPVRVPLKRRITWARSTQESMEHVYLRMNTDEDVTGIGEGLAYVPWSGETLASIVVSLREIFEPLLVGRNPLSYREIWSQLDSVAGHDTAKAMIE